MPRSEWSSHGLGGTRHCPRLPQDPVEQGPDGSQASNKKLIARQISWGKRALACANGSVVKEITIEEVKEIRAEKEEGL